MERGFYGRAQAAGRSPRAPATAPKLACLPACLLACFPRGQQGWRPAGWQLAGADSRAGLADAVVVDGRLDELSRRCTWASLKPPGLKLGLKPGLKPVVWDGDLCYSDGIPVAGARTLTAASSSPRRASALTWLRQNGSVPGAYSAARITRR